MVFRTRHIPDEHSRESLTIRVKRKLKSKDFAEKLLTTTDSRAAPLESSAHVSAAPSAPNAGTICMAPVRARSKSSGMSGTLKH